MAWRIEITRTAEQDISKLDRSTQRDIVRYLRERLEPCDDPRAFGKVLHGEMRGLWRYRVRDYRIICQILDEKVTILVLTVQHRREAYR